MKRFLQFGIIAIALILQVTSSSAQTLNVVSGSPQDPSTTSSFGLTLSDPTGQGFDQNCSTDGYGNTTCFGTYNVTISQSGYTYYTGSLNQSAPFTNLSVTMSESQSVPNNSSFNVTVTKSGSAYSPWSCSNCFRTSNLQVSITNNAGCDAYGDLVAAVTGGQAPFSYSWSGGGSGQTRFISSGGTYSVTVTDANSVSQTASITIANPVSVSSTNGSYADNCVGASVSAAVDAYTGTSPFSYSWSSGSNTSTATGLLAGSYTVTVTDDNGCTAQSTSTVTYVPEATVVSGGTQDPSSASFALTLSDPTGGDFDASTDAYGVTTPYLVEIYDCNNVVYYSDQITSGTMPIGWDGELDLTMVQQVAPAQNTAYNIRVTDQSLSGDVFECSECFVTTNAAPPNDLCTNAIAITCGGTETGSTEFATNTDELDNVPGPGVWYVFTGNGDDVTVSTDNAGTDYDTRIGYTDGCGNAGIDFDEDGGDVYVNGWTSVLTFPTVQGTDYYIYVGGYQGTNTGNFELSVSCVTPPPAPVNDDVCSPTALSMGANGPFTNVAATADVNDPVVDPATDGCSGDDGWCFDTDVENSVWFTFEAPASGNVIVSTSGSTFDTQLAVYETVSCQDFASGTQIQLGANDDDPAGGTTSAVTLCGLNPGQTYFVLVDGYAGAEGDITLTLTETTLDAAFTFSTTGLEVEFTDASTASGTITDWAWDFGDGGTSMMADTTYNFTADGAYTVCLTVTDEGGCTSTDCQTVQAADITISITEAVERSMNVYPNPSNGQFVLEINGVEANVQLNVLDLAGRVVYTEGAVLNGNFRKELNIEAATGTYLMQVVTPEGMVTRKLMID